MKLNAIAMIAGAALVGFSGSSLEAAALKSKISTNPTAHTPVWDSEIVTSDVCPGYNPFSATNQIYVSSSQGNDNNSGLSPQAPVRTLVKGYELLARGGWLLLKAGDTFEGPNQSLNGIHGSFQKEGLSAEQPTVITSYGSGAMPILAGDPQYGYVFFIRGQTRQHIAIIGLNFYNFRRDPRRADFNPNHPGNNAISMDYGVSHIDICGNTIQYFSGGIVAQSIDTVNRIHDLRIRNNQISRQWTRSGSGHAQGMYIDKVVNLTISGNTFIHNGWLDANIVPGSHPTIYNHNFYLNGIENLTVEENIFAYGSSMCAKNRSDQAGGFKNVVYRKNICLRTPIGFSFGGVIDPAGGFQYQNVLVEDNFYIERGNDHPGAQSVMWGISAMQVENLTLRRNKLFNNVEFDNANAIQITLSSSPVTLSENEIYNFRNLGFDIRGSGTPPLASSNYIQSASMAITDDQMMRTVAHYNFFIGGSNDVEGFIEELERQSYSNWRPAYTAANVIHYLNTGTLRTVSP